MPKLIGPSAIKAMLPPGKQLPHGFLMNDIRIAGPVPYRGEQVGITVVLFKVRTNDYAQRVLQIAEGLSDVLGLAAIGNIAKIGNSVVDSLQALFSMNECEPVLGQRFEINASKLDGLPVRQTALISETAPSATSLRIVEDRLVNSDGAQYSEADFVLYNVWGVGSVGTGRGMPFYPDVEKMYEIASSGDETSWERAKAALITLYQRLRSSPDLTSADADKLFESYKNEIVKRRDVIRYVRTNQELMGDKRSKGYQEVAEANEFNRRAKEVFAL